MSHSSIDADVRVWAEKHSLRITSGWAGRQVWNAYMSSAAGECFQVWIEPITNGKVRVQADYVDGPREPALIEESDLQNALERAYEQVVNWMAPSARDGHV
jgi:hypothetical protein